MDADMQVGLPCFCRLRPLVLAHRYVSVTQEMHGRARFAEGTGETQAEPQVDILLENASDPSRPRLRASVGRVDRDS